MSDSVYRKTPLPVKLNLNDRNTREQLNSGLPEGSARGTLEGAGLATATTASQSQKNCTDVMRKDLQDWLEARQIHGPPPSPEEEQRAMWQWIREFHKEYNDDWFSRNMPRLHERFRPVFQEKMRGLKKRADGAGGTAADPVPGACDLLDFDPPAAPAGAGATAAAAAAKPAPGSDDLLSLDDFSAPAAPAPPAAAPAAGLPAPAPAPAPALATTASGGGDLIGLDACLLAAAPVAAPAAALAAAQAAAPAASPADALAAALAAPAPAVPVAAPVVAAAAQAPAPPMAAGMATPAAAPQRQEANLLDLMM